MSPNRIAIIDNGVGMTPSDLDKHFWTAGSSSKNTEAARAAGVVGTFGIGAMANFGIADKLVVETESAVSGERTVCRADRAKLSINDPCIEREILVTTGSPGTRVTAEIPAGAEIDVPQAQNYIKEFLSLVDVPVFVNGQLVSQRPIDEAVPVVPETWRMEQHAAKIGDRLIADVLLVLSNNAEIWLKLTKYLVWAACFRTSASAQRSIDASNISEWFWFGNGIREFLLSIWRYRRPPVAGADGWTERSDNNRRAAVSSVHGYRY